MSELYPDAGAREPLRDVDLFASADMLGSASLSDRYRGLGEGDRRGRGARGERLLRGDDLSRLALGGENLLVEIGDRLRSGERDLADRAARLRLLSLSRAELCPCGLSLDTLRGEWCR